MAGIIVIVFLEESKSSSHKAHISEHNNSSNLKIHSYDQMSKMIVNLGSNKYKSNNTPSCQLTCIQNSLLMIIVNTPEKDLSHVDGKDYIIKVHKSAVKSSSTLFSCSSRAMYNIVNRSKKCLMLNSHLPGIN